MLVLGFAIYIPLQSAADCRANPLTNMELFVQLMDFNEH
jgi:hypothetical protein